MCLCVYFCYCASCTKTSSSCGSFPSLYIKPINETKSHGKRVKRAVERSVLFCEKARHWLNFKEKLMDLFLLTIFIEQSTEPGAKKGPSLCYKQISSLCWGFYPKMRLLHLIVRNTWLRKKEKKKKKTSVLQVSL